MDKKENNRQTEVGIQKDEKQWLQVYVVDGRGGQREEDGIKTRFIHSKGKTEKKKKKCHDGQCTKYTHKSEISTSPISTNQKIPF